MLIGAHVHITEYWPNVMRSLRWVLTREWRHRGSGSYKLASSQTINAPSLSASQRAIAPLDGKLSDTNYYNTALSFVKHCLNPTRNATISKNIYFRSPRLQCIFRLGKANKGSPQTPFLGKPVWFSSTFQCHQGNTIHSFKQMGESNYLRLG